MASHGVARAIRKRTEEQRLEDLEKIKKYRDLEDQVRTNVAQGNLGPELFQLTSKLLRLNPEYYTIWNVRRRSLISGLLSKPSAGSSPSKASPTSSPTATTTPSSAALSSSSSTATPPGPNPPTTGQTGTTADVDASFVADDESRREADQQNDADVLRSELGFTIPLLLESPKCYWIWKYRLWLLQETIERLDVQMARRVWEEELGLASKMLTKDKRNFHAWGYRRKVVAKLESAELDGKSMVEPEFEYTYKMIGVDLSNFSAWHNRSKLIPRLLDERGADAAARKDFLETELNLVREALNVGPEDQSLWFYHGFLMREITDYTGRPTITPNLSESEREEYVCREIDFIKDLLEDYDDIKWLYDALLEYSVDLWNLTGLMPQPDELDEYWEWLQRLQKLDPMRKGRWDDFEMMLRKSARESSGL